MPSMRMVALQKFLRRCRFRLYGKPRSYADGTASPKSKNCQKCMVLATGVVVGAPSPGPWIWAFLALPALKVITAKVEMKHVVGQQMKTGRSKGKALKPQSLSRRTYRVTAMEAGARLRRHIRTEVLGKDARVGKRFGQFLQKYKFGRTLKGKGKKRGISDLADGALQSRTKMKRPVRALDVFLRQEYNADGKLSLAERQRCNEAWRHASDQRKEQLQAIAEAETKELEEFSAKTFQELVNGAPPVHMSSGPPPPRLLSYNGNLKFNSISSCILQPDSDYSQTCGAFFWHRVDLGVTMLVHFTA